MKFLTDENIAKSVVKALKNADFDVKDVKEEGLQGSSDKEILQIAYRENRIIVTHDKDFRNVLSSKVKHKGIILLRLMDQSPNNVKSALLQVLKSDIKNKIKDNLTVISEKRVTIHR